jgi:pyruvate/2-oxoglutarate dehydrogenase complex dihydrolipoamide dehydrogenase (E3) component
MVSLFEFCPRLRAGGEPFAGDQLAASLRDQGVDVHTDTQAIRARRHERDGTEAFSLTLADGTELISDELLVAVGRKPHTADLGLETVGLRPGETIEVDDQMRVPGHDWLYAIGDVNGRTLLTHAGKYQARVATGTIMNRPARAVWDGELSPRVVFTEPQVAAVGRTLEQALDAGVQAIAVDADISATPGASFIGKGATATARLVVDERRRVVVGATFTGPEVADWLQAATIAIVGEVPLERLIHAIPPFPTRSEVWLKLLAQWDF